MSERARGARAMINKVLLWKELRVQRPVLLAGVAFAVVMPFLVAGALSTEQGFVLSYVAVMLPTVFALLWSGVGVAAGAITVATEVEDGTERFLLSRPVSRAQVWSIKVGAAAAMWVATGLLFVAVVRLVAGVAGPPASDFRELSGTIDWALFSPLTVLAVGVLMFGCGVLCSTVVHRPLTAAAAAVAVGLAVMAAVLLLWSMLELNPYLEPQWLAAELIVVAASLLTTSLLVFSWPDQFAARAAAAGTPGRVAMGGCAALLLCAGLLPLIFDAATPRREDNSVVPGSVSRGDRAVVMSLRTSGGTTQNWILMTDGSGARALTGRHTGGARWLWGNGLIAYYSQRGALGNAGNGLDLRVVDASGSTSWLVFSGMPGERELFFKDGGFWLTGNYSKVAFTSGAELTVAYLHGRGHETFNISGVPLANATLLGFNYLDEEDELVFVSGEIDLAAATLRSAGTLLAYEISSGRTRELRQLAAGSALPARLQNRRPDATGVSGGYESSRMVVVAIEPREDGTAGARIEGVDTVTGEARVVTEIDTAWRDDGERRVFQRCNVVESAPTRSWGDDEGRFGREAQVLFGDCSSIRTDGGAGAIRLVGVDTGRERTWALPPAWQGTLRRIYLGARQETILLDIESTPATSHAITIDLNGVVRTYPAGWRALGWTTLDYFLLQRDEGGEVTFAAGDARTGEVYELYPDNELRDVLRQRARQVVDGADKTSQGQ